jgi:periplasmic copper chaperone A
MSTWSTGCYLAIRNRGAAPDRLLSASSPEARVVGMHETSMEGGGAHLMLAGPKRAFGWGEHVPLMPTFEHAGEVRVEMTVEAAEARCPATGSGHGDHTPPART